MEKKIIFFSIIVVLLINVSFMLYHIELDKFEITALNLAAAVATAVNISVIFTLLLGKLFGLTCGITEWYSYNQERGCFILMKYGEEN